MVKIKSAKTLIMVFSAAILFLAPHAAETSENNDSNIGKPGTWTHSQVDTCLKNAPKDFAAKTNCYYEHIAYCIVQIGEESRQTCYRDSLPWWISRLELLEENYPKLIRNLFAQEWETVCARADQDPQCHVDKITKVLLQYEYLNLHKQ